MICKKAPPASLSRASASCHVGRVSRLVIPLVVAHAAGFVGAGRLFAVGSWRRRRTIVVVVIVANVKGVVVLVLDEGPRQVVRVVHVRVRVDAGVQVVVPVGALSGEELLVLERGVVGADGDAARAPLVGGRCAAAAAAAGTATNAANTTAGTTAERRGALLVITDAVVIAVAAAVHVLAEDAAQQPALSYVVGVDDAAVAELDALARPVDPGKVEVEQGLDDAENDGEVVEQVVGGVEGALDPVEDVEAAVGAEGEQIVGVNDGRNGGLAQEQQLGQDGDGLEDLGEGPEPLGGLVER